MDVKADDKMRLLDIADAIREIQGYLGGADYEEYSINDDMRESVTAQLVIMGGAAALLSDEFKEEYGNIDWEMLKGFQYAHYDEELELDHHSILHIAKNDLPLIMDDILDVASMLEDEDDLEGVTLNEEDLRDVKTMQEDKRNHTGGKAEEVFSDEDNEEAEENEKEQESLNKKDDSYIDIRYNDAEVIETSSLDDEDENEDDDENTADGEDYDDLDETEDSEEDNKISRK